MTLGKTIQFHAPQPERLSWLAVGSIADGDREVYRAATYEDVARALRVQLAEQLSEAEKLQDSCEAEKLQDSCEAEKLQDSCEAETAPHSLIARHNALAIHRALTEASRPSNRGKVACEPETAPHTLRLAIHLIRSLAELAHHGRPALTNTRLDVRLMPRDLEAVAQFLEAFEKGRVLR
jgi:hypothetical protein